MQDGSYGWETIAQFQGRHYSSRDHDEVGFHSVGSKLTMNIDLLWLVWKFIYSSEKTSIVE